MSSVYHSRLHRQLLPEAFAEPLGSLSENYDWKPSPSVNWSQASPILGMGGERLDRAGEEDGERGEGSVMTSGLDTDLGKDNQYNSYRNQPPYSTHAHLEHL